MSDSGELKSACLVCGKPFKRLIIHIQRKHGLSQEEYDAKYRGIPVKVEPQGLVETVTDVLVRGTNLGEFAQAILNRVMERQGEALRVALVAMGIEKLKRVGRLLQVLGKAEERLFQPEAIEAMSVKELLLFKRSVDGNLSDVAISLERALDAVQGTNLAQTSGGLHYHDHRQQQAVVVPGLPDSPSEREAWLETLREITQLIHVPKGAVGGNGSGLHS